jgi:O-succinylbenzoic acid--CoA ligase
MRVEPWLVRAAAAVPDRVAIETPTRALSYRELLAAADAAAGWLGERVRPGQRVAIALPAGVDFAVALHGVLRAGAIAVPVDLRLGARERDRLRAGAALTVEEPIAPRAVAAGSGSSGEAGSAHGGPARAAARGGSGHDLDAAAAVIHSSGTDGDPKPVELTYGNWLWSALGSGVALGVDPDERWLCALPLAHVGGLSILMRSVIYATTAVVHERFDTEAVLEELMRSDGATLVSLVPTTLARLLDAGLREPPRLRCALLGGGPVPAAMVARAREAGVPVRQTYGLTEACSQASTQPAGGSARPDRRDGPPLDDAGPKAATDDAGREGAVADDAGPPLFCARVRCSDDGEILVAGPTVAPAAAGPDGWLRTGDLGELVGGRLRVVGRKAETIVSGGENVAPAEVEAVLIEHPAVADAAVIGRPDPRWGEAITAIVVLAAGERANAGELRDHCAGRLAPFKVPKTFSFTGRLPRTPSGKLMRREL